MSFKPVTAQRAALYSWWATTTIAAAAAALSACGGSDSGGSSVTVTAATDTYTLGYGQSAQLLANDTIGSAAANAGVGGNAVFRLTTVTVPAGLAITSDGVVTLSGPAVPGVVNLAYQLCEAASPSNCATANITLTIPALGTLSGRAIDAATGGGVPSVTVSAGGLTATTDSTGAFSIAGLAATPRLTVLFNASTHAEAAGITRISGAANSELQVRMLRVATTATVPVASGGTVTVAGSPAQVVLPPDGLQRADGSIPTGNVTVQLTPIDPASDSAVMPGDFTTLVGGTATSIESYGALNVRLADAAGATLNLRSGQSATVRIAVATRSTTVPATIPLFYFDTPSGRWIQEGTATLAGTGNSRYYQGTVTHFSTWNADQVMDSVRVTGCVADANGSRVANAFVASDGIDYSGTSSATSNGTGDFTIIIRRSSLATLVALSGGTLSNTLSAGPYAVDTTLPACLVLDQAAAGVTMKLTWGAAPGDLDSHLFTPSGAHVYYGNDGNLLAAPYAALDVDDTSSFGPEVITLTKLMVGTYKYYVHNFSGYSDGALAASSARVELNIPGRNAELFTPPATGETSSTEVWTLFELDVDAQCNVSVRRVPGYADTEPAPPATGTPVYCTRP